MIKERLRKLWHFLWHDDSALSWFVNLILAFILVKFIIYPGLGLILGTQFPIVAVVSGSMEHQGMDFDSWWAENGEWYEERNIDAEEFEEYSFVNGFNKGDIMVLKGLAPQDIKRGDVVVYQSSIHPNPIIHRIVDIKDNEQIMFVTKGDNNRVEDRQEVSQEQISATGKAIFRVPFFGWIKIWFVDIVGGK